MLGLPQRLHDCRRLAGADSQGRVQAGELRTGDGVNDDTVANQIRNGSAQMPAVRNFAQGHDIADLLALSPRQVLLRGDQSSRQSLVPGDARRIRPRCAPGQSQGRPEGPCAQHARRRARRHHGAVDRAQCRSHHRLQRSGRSVRVSAIAARLLHLADRKAAAIPALPARRREDRGRRPARRHRPRTALRDRFSSGRSRHPASAHRCRVDVEPGRHRRGEIHVQPHLRRTAATPTSKS